MGLADPHPGARPGFPLRGGLPQRALAAVRGRRRAASGADVRLPQRPRHRRTPGGPEQRARVIFPKHRENTKKHSIFWDNHGGTWWNMVKNGENDGCIYHCDLYSVVWYFEWTFFPVSREINSRGWSKIQITFWLTWWCWWSKATDTCCPGEEYTFGSCRICSCP